MQKWSEQKDELHQATKKLIEKYLNAYSEREDKEANLTEFYSNLCFSELFLHYAGQRKGDIALQILTNPKMYDENEQSSAPIDLGPPPNINTKNVSNKMAEQQEKIKETASSIIAEMDKYYKE